MAETMNGAMYLSHSRDVVLNGKSINNTPDEVDVELDENFGERPSVLSVNDNISNSLKRGGTEDIKII